MYKIAVIGSRGFLGSNLVGFLACLGHTVYSCARPDLRSNASRDGTSISFDLMRLDESALWGLRPDVVINCAAYGVKSGEADERLAADVNVIGPLNLVRKCSENGVSRLLHIGSAAEYGGRSYNVSEDSGLNPMGLYGRTKAAGSLLTISTANSLGLSASVVRPFAFYGPGEDSSKFVPAVISSLLNKKSIALSNGLAVRDYTYITDVCEAIALLTDIRLALPPELNVASGVPISMKEFGVLIASCLHASKDLLLWGHLSSRVYEAPRLIGSSEKIRKYTSWNPRTTLVEGIKKTARAEICRLGEGDN